MPNINPEARRWELDVADRFGEAVNHRRKRLGLTALQLSERTKDLGYPITRVAITKIERNQRAGKVDVAECLVLAAALEIPPILLLFPDYPDGAAELIPHHVVSSRAAARWISGLTPMPAGDADEEAVPAPPNAGTELIEAVEALHNLQVEESRRAEKALPKGGATDGLAVGQGVIRVNPIMEHPEVRLERYRERISRAALRIHSAKSRIWGGRGDG